MIGPAPAGGETERSGGRTADRRIAIGLIIGGVLYSLLAFRLEVGAFSDPVGPRVYPIILAVAVIATAILLLARPSSLVIEMPARGTVLHGTFLLLCLVAYGYLLEPIGYLLSTTAMMLILSLLFGGTRRNSLIAAAAVTAALYLIFSVALGLYLPLGPAL